MTRTSGPAAAARGLLAEVGGRATAFFLRTPWLARSPLGMHRRGLGRHLGPRMLMLEHVGRSSGLPRQVVLEVVEEPRPGTYRVVSALGPRSQWYQNLLAHPGCRVSTGELADVPATAYPVPQHEVRRVLERYAEAHPTAWAVLERATREHVPPGVSPADHLPAVDLVLDDAGDPATTDADGTTPADR